MKSVEEKDKTSKNDEKEETRSRKEEKKMKMKKERAMGREGGDRLPHQKLKNSPKRKK